MSEDCQQPPDISTIERSRVARLRQALASDGFRLVMTRRRNMAHGNGGFLVTDLTTGDLIIGGDPVPFCATLDEVEEWASRTNAYRAVHQKAHSNTLTAEQCISARELLAWSRVRLGSQALVPYHSVRALETGIWIRPEVVAAIRAALEAAGVEFIAENGGGAGARLRKDQP